MTKKFSELRQSMAPERQERARRRTDRILAGLRLRKLREERKITQQQLAEELHRTQAAISQIEQRNDVLLSTLTEYIEATGGELVLVARYPEGDVAISALGAPAGRRNPNEKWRSRGANA